MGNQQYALHLHIPFVTPRKPGLSPTYPLDTMNFDIAVANRQYQNIFHDYHPVKNMNSALYKIVVAAIDNQ